jgi:hypothetical protein
MKIRAFNVATLMMLLGATVGAVDAQAPSAAIRLHPENPRYLEWKGRPIVLVASGEHYGSVINPDFDYMKYLATIQAAGLNHTRIFLGDYVEGPGSFGIVNNPLAPAEGRLLAPWARSSTPGFARGGNKFDLDRWDPAYFERLHAFFAEAERRGIVVEAVLFFVGPGYDYTPLNPKNNVNSTTPIDGKRYLSLDNGNVLARQEAYCRKLVRELNRYPNLILNLCNEPWFYNQETPGFASQPPAAVKAWIQRVSEWVADEESLLPSKHLMSVDLTNQGSPVAPSDLKGYFARLSVFNVHYDANGGILRDNPSLKKVLAFNETGFNGTGDEYYRTQGWNFLLSGGGLYGNLDFSFSVGHEDGSGIPTFTGNYNAGGSAAVRRQLGILNDFMRSLPLEKMQPENGIIVGGADGWSALAAPGIAYAAWFPGEGPIHPVVAVPPGKWRAEWVDILTGTVTSQEFTQKSWITTLAGVRRGGGVALRIVNAGQGPAVGDPGSQSASASPAPRPDALMLEDFESYSSNEDLAKHWYKPPHGAWMQQSLAAPPDAHGNQSLKFDHRLSDQQGQNYSAICIMKKWDLSPYNTLQFWLKPDGSGREVTMQFNIADAQGANIHDLWQATYKPLPGDKLPRIVSIPFSDLKQPRWLDPVGKSPVFKPADVIELAAYVSAGNGHFGEGAYYIDDIQAIKVPEESRAKEFGVIADEALAAMKKRATELGIGGVAVVAYFEGDKIQSWSSKMLIVGRMKDEPSASSKGANLLAIAYTKASEMADTLKDSGSGVRPPMTGEFGWQGGVIARAKTGYVIAAFSGGKSEDDLEASRAGLAVLKAGL